MGEIADMLINGFMCECCGEFLDGDEPGFARYCSVQCAEDRGADISQVIDEDDEDENISLDDLKTKIEINISMLDDNARDLKKFNQKKSRALKGLIKNLNSFLASL